MRIRTGLLASVLLSSVVGWPQHAAAADRPILKRAMPVYPELARRMRIYGLIRLTVFILPNGEVSDVALESGHPLLVNAAKDAVRQWKFAAAPEASTTSVVVRFDLPN